MNEIALRKAVLEAFVDGPPAVVRAVEVWADGAEERPGLSELAGLVRRFLRASTSLEDITIDGSRPMDPRPWAGVEQAPTAHHGTELLLCRWMRRNEAEALIRGYVQRSDLWRIHVLGDGRNSGTFGGHMRPVQLVIRVLVAGAWPTRGERLAAEARRQLDAEADAEDDARRRFEVLLEADPVLRDIPRGERERLRRRIGLDGTLLHRGTSTGLGGYVVVEMVLRGEMICTWVNDHDLGFVDADGPDEYYVYGNRLSTMADEGVIDRQVAADGWRLIAQFRQADEEQARIASIAGAGTTRRPMLLGPPVETGLEALDAPVDVSDVALSPGLVRQETTATFTDRNGQSYEVAGSVEVEVTAIEPDDPSNCPACEGSGSIQFNARGISALGACPICGGTGVRTAMNDEDLADRVDALRYAALVAGTWDPEQAAAVARAFERASVAAEGLGQAAAAAVASIDARARDAATELRPRGRGDGVSRIRALLASVTAASAFAPTPPPRRSRPCPTCSRGGGRRRRGRCPTCRGSGVIE